MWIFKKHNCIYNKTINKCLGVFFFILMRIRILDPFCKNIDPKFPNFLRVILLLDFNDPWIRGSANADFEIKYF